MASIGLYAADFLLNVLGNGNVLIGTTADAGYKLRVNGTSYFDGLAHFGQTATSGSAFRWGTYGTAVSADTMLAHNQLWNGSGWTILDSAVGTSFLNLGGQVASPNIQFGTGGANTAATTKMIILNNGNVGIGTTAPGEKLVVGSLGGGIKRIYVPGTYNFDGSYLSNYDSNGGGKIELVAHTGVSNSASWRIANNNDTYGQSLTFSYAPSATSYSGLSYSAPAMLIANNGNVGIGTTSPSQKLEVAGDVLIQGGGAGDRGLTITATTAGSAALNLNAQTGGVARIRANNFPLVFDTNSTERMRITAAGNVGIGTTTPGASLTVGTQSSGSSGSGVAQDNSIIARFGASNAAARVTGATVANTATATIGNDATLSFIVAGNYSATGLISSILRNTTTAGTDMAFSLYNNSMQERMRITAGGNVGIGTANPQKTLHVAGTVQIDSTSTAPNQIGGSVDTLYTNSASDNIAMGVPDNWLQITIDGVTYAIPAYNPA
jgi:hypothetical protein